MIFIQLSYKVIDLPVNIATPTPTSFVNPRNNQACIQVITPAKNPKTGKCQNFPTPCDVPDNWQKVSSCDN